MWQIRTLQKQWRNASERLTMLKKDQEIISGSCTKIDQLHQHYTSLGELFTSCSSNFSDCILDDSGKRTKAVDMLSKAVSSVLPNTYEKSIHSPIPDCFSAKQCADIDKTKVHEREVKACNVIHSRESIGKWFKSWVVSPEWKDVQEFLRFRADDPREKLLYVSALLDKTGSLNPSFAAGILSALAQKYDIKYIVNCSKVEDAKIQPFERTAVQAIQKDLASKYLVSDADDPSGKEYLSVCSDDPRDKALHFVAETDQNGALHPDLVSGVLGVFADRFDLQTKTIASMTEICRTVDTASRFGNVAVVILDAHGTPLEGMTLSKTADGKEERLTTQSDVSCFLKMKKDAVVVLSGGSVGQDSSHANNLAQKISDISQRIVLAPTCPLYPSQISIRSTDPLMFHHPSHSSAWNFFVLGCNENNENIFKTFSPKSQP